MAQSFDRSVRTTDNREAAIPRKAQDESVVSKLAALKEKTGKKPNILWIVVDDMGYGDPGCYGGGAAIGAATPNIDKLASEGLKLTSCYSQHTCTPTRSAILTGRLPVRTGLTRPILAGDKITKNPWEGELSLPKLLGDAGYVSLLTGKWHIGESKGMRPHDVGFDEFYGYYPAQKEISQGVSTAEIARSRGVSEQAIDKSISRISKHLGIPKSADTNQRVQIVRAFFENKGQGI